MSTLRDILAACTDETLAALASPGLLRRAQKDLARVAIRLEAERDDELRVAVDDAVVTIPAAGPARAACTCPAPGACRHLLGAVLFLRQQAPPPAAATLVPEAHAELLALSLETLREYAGKPVLRQAVALLTQLEPLTIEQGETLVLHLQPLGLAVRWLPGAGLAGALVAGPATKRETFLLAAVLAYQREHGQPLPPEVLAELATTPGARRDLPREPPALLAAAAQLLTQLAANGLAHLSAGNHERLTTLAIATAAAGLPRLALGLRRLAEEGELLLRRDGQADAQRLFDELCRTAALVASLQTGQAPPGVVGQARTQYLEIAQLDLLGAGAYAWRTTSGYRGLTVLLWSAERQDWFTWGVARATAQDPGFAPAAAFAGLLPWQCAGTVEQLAGQRLRLLRPRLNAQRRLSSSSQSQGYLAGAVSWADYAFGERCHTRWATLRDLARQLARPGLQPDQPTDRLLVLSPAAWLDRRLDPIAQRYVCGLADDQGEVVELRVPADADHAGAIAWLEHLDPQRDGVAALVGRLDWQGGELSVYPLVVLRQHGAPWSLTLQPPPVPLTGIALPSVGAPVAAPTATIPPPLAAAHDRLLALAERGTLAMSAADRTALTAAADQLEPLALLLLARWLRALAAAPEPATALLRAGYLCHLYRAASEA